MDFCLGMVKCFLNLEGWVKKSVLFDKVFGFILMKVCGVIVCDFVIVVL